MKRARSPFESHRVWLRWFKGALLIFFALILAGCSAFSGRSRPPGIAILFAKQSKNGHETLVLGRYNAKGQREGPWISIGRLGLVAQTQIMASHGGNLWITTGLSLKQFAQSGSVRTLWSAPGHSAILSVDYIAGHLWAIVEPIDGRVVDIYRRQQGHFVNIATGPLAITTLYPAPFDQLGILRVWPDKAQVQLWQPDRKSRQWTVHAVPQGTMGLTKTKGYLPVTEGLHKFGMASVSLKGTHLPSIRFYRHVSQAVIEVIPSNPLYGITVQGVVALPGSKSRPVPRKWPQPLLATVTTAVQSPASWLIILDGPSQGLWFNPRSDSFGPVFQVTAPKGAFPRAVQPWGG